MTAVDEYHRDGHNPEIVERFLSEVYESGFILPFNWPGSRIGEVLQELDGADMETLRKLVTAMARADRVNDGTMSRLCADGTIERILNRLDELAKLSD